MNDCRLICGLKISTDKLVRDKCLALVFTDDFLRLPCLTVCKLKETKLKVRVFMTKMCIKVGRLVRSQLLQHTKLPVVMIEEIVAYYGTYYDESDVTFIDIIASDLVHNSLTKSISAAQATLSTIALT
jgi:hypothetical protein